MNFFASILDFFESIWTFINNLVSSLITAISVVSLSSTFAVHIVGYLPSFLGGCVVAVVAISVIKLLVGWGNS